MGSVELQGNTNANAAVVLGGAADIADCNLSTNLVGRHRQRGAMGLMARDPGSIAHASGAVHVFVRVRIHGT